jgi:hypothetical protein
MAPQILRALNQVGYLAYFAKVVPQGDYTALFTLPANSSSQYGELLGRLREKGILADFTLDEVLVRRHKTMDPRFFNFRSGRWEVEWAKVAAETPAPLSPGKRPHAEDFDYYDLLVIKELQKDALQHLTGIARKLKVHQKTLEYHYRTHVQKWKLIPSYRIRWAQDTTKRPVHSTTFTRLVFDNLSRAELAEVQGAISKVPFLWLEDLLQSGTYIATMYIPLTDLQSVLSYVSAPVPNLGSRVEVGFVDHSEASSFTIPYNMYQEDSWKFDIRQMERALQKESIVPIQK